MAANFGADLKNRKFVENSSKYSVKMHLTGNTSWNQMKKNILKNHFQEVPSFAENNQKIVRKLILN
jgi:hypothetical protein